MMRWERRLPVVVALIVLGCAAARTHQALTVWQSDLTVWRHAAHVAPFKPRPATNYGVALLMARDPLAVWQLRRAWGLTHGSQVPDYDRALTQRTIRRTLIANGLW